MPVRGLLIDQMSRSATACLSLLYFGALLALALGASLTPDRFERATFRLDPAPCAPDPASCVVDVNAVTTSGLVPGNQFLMIAGSMGRPLVAATGAPALLGSAVSFPQTYTFSLTHTNTGVPADDPGATTTLLNLTHTTAVTCDAGAATCSLGVLAYLPAVTFDSLSMDIQLYGPQAPFWAALNQAVPLVPLMNVTFTTVSVRDTYTLFEMGWRYFGVAVSLLVWLFYTVMLVCGPGTRDEETGKRVAMTFEQQYVWWLSMLVVFLDRPGFATEVVTPSLGAYAFGAVTQTTAVAALLFFFLFHFHVIALQSEAGASGVQWDLAAYADDATLASFDEAAAAGAGGEGAGVPRPRLRRIRLGACFWIPKVSELAGGLGLGGGGGGSRRSHTPAHTLSATHSLSSSRRRCSS